MMTIPEATKEATHTLLQRGPTMQAYDTQHPPPIRDLTNAYDTYTRAFQSDFRGGTVSKTPIVRIEEIATRIDHRKRSLQMQQQRKPWCTHQPSPCVTKKRLNIVLSNNDLV